jgi:hypothetical protein
MPVTHLEIRNHTTEPDRPQEDQKPPDATDWSTMTTQLQRISDQLDVLTQLLDIALRQTDPVVKRRWLTVIKNATEATRAEYEQATETELRIA